MAEEPLPDWLSEMRGQSLGDESAPKAEPEPEPSLPPSPPLAPAPAPAPVSDPFAESEATPPFIEDSEPDRFSQLFADLEPVEPDADMIGDLRDQIVLGEEDLEDYDVFVELAGTAIPSMAVSVTRGRNLTAFIEKMYEMLNIIRVYTRAPGKEPDFTSPFVLPRESKLEDLGEKIHKDFKDRLKYARIWGTAVYDGQMVQRDYVLQEGDVAEFHV